MENFGGIANVNKCTFYSNAGKLGGGLSNYSGGTFNLTNSTIYNNTATDEGGGVWSDGTTNVTFCTIAQNSAPAGGGFYNEVPLSFVVKNSILAGNTGGSCDAGALSVPGSGTKPECNRAGSGRRRKY